MGVRHAPIPTSGTTASPKCLGTSYMHETAIKLCMMIKRDVRKVFTGLTVILPWRKFLVTQILTQDLFAVDNIHVRNNRFHCVVIHKLQYGSGSTESVLWGTTYCCGFLLSTGLNTNVIHYYKTHPVSGYIFSRDSDACQFHKLFNARVFQDPYVHVWYQVSNFITQSVRLVPKKLNP